MGGSAAVLAPQLPSGLSESADNNFGNSSLKANLSSPMARSKRSTTSKRLPSHLVGGLPLPTGISGMMSEMIALCSQHSSTTPLSFSSAGTSCGSDPLAKLSFGVSLRRAASAEIVLSKVFAPHNHNRCVDHMIYLRVFPAAR